VLKNFYLDSTCSITGGQKVGIIGNHDGAGALFENIGSAAHVDGEGENVSGLLGGAWAANGTVTINSCWMVGEIDTRGPYNPANCGIFAGWTNTGTFVFNDCWAIAIVPNSTNESKYFARQGKNMTLNNCYSLFGSQVHPIPGYEDAADIQKIPATDRAALYEQVRQELATGALAWAVNGDQQTIKWYQNIGEDAHPTFDASHQIVFLKDDGTYYNDGTTAIRTIATTLGNKVSVFDAQGRMVRSNVSASEAVKGMTSGMYILKGEGKSIKVLVK
jgi:hypothetical protein